MDTPFEYEAAGGQAPRILQGTQQGSTRGQVKGSLYTQWIPQRVDKQAVRTGG